jgi:hypothetical protein
MNLGTGERGNDSEVGMTEENGPIDLYYYYYYYMMLIFLVI